MGSYFSSYEEPAVASYTINSYSDSNLIIDRIERNNDGDIVIFYKSPENL
jgi:hypothetical protein